MKTGQGILVGALCGAGLIAMAGSAALSSVGTDAGLPAVLRVGAPDEPPARFAAAVGVQARQIDFRKEIVPILKQQCYSCHNDDKSRGGLSLASRETLLAGGNSGSAVVPGNSGESLLMRLVRGDDPKRAMPYERPRLPDAQIELLRAWIDQGLAWDVPLPDVDAASQYELALRKVEPPAEPALTNPIDQLLAAYWRTANREPGAPVPDALFARRVYLDVVGLLPTPDELAEFERDVRAEKRAELIRRLLADRERYAEHWMSYWNDLLRNDYAGAGYIDGGRKQISQWLYAALYENMPYDRFVAGLVAPEGDGAAGFTGGIVWRGVVNASQTPPMQAAQNVSQVFLGLNLKCASCHDSFINDWKLADAYGLASVFADGPLEMHRCDQSTGQTATVKFLFPQLGAIDAAAPRAARQARLAELLTHTDNGRFSRTIVNRLWARFFGRGLIEPPDEMDRPAWSADLLDYLASDLVRHGYDLKHTMELMLASRAYQMPAVDGGELTADDFVFHGPIVRRMTGEQFVDAVRQVTGNWPSKPNVRIATLGAAAANPAGAWIWNDETAGASAPGGTPLYFRRAFSLPAAPQDAIAVVTCDNEFTLYVNGSKAATGRDHYAPQRVDLRGHLGVGENVIAVQALNFAVTGPDGKPSTAANPAGLYVLIRAWVEDSEAAIEVASDASWRWSSSAADGWNGTGFDAAAWQPAAVIGPANTAPWMLGERIAEAAYDPASPPRIRAVFQIADPLTTALGRPGRDQVVTVRPTAATTLQALELTNGRTLDAMLVAGAARLRGEPARAAAEVVKEAYGLALGREPTDAESQIGTEMVGSPATAEGIADLLWALVMLPEFQLIE
ncbi:MAG: hypothetical protein CHACPFDD_03325 [Phycisphaerae bacterium]|nr:hypothetical protein [Phycisphaerae bacterium]